MKHTSRFLAFLLILTLVPTVFVPAVSAYSWTEISEFEVGSTDGGHLAQPFSGGAITLSDTNILMGLSSGASGGSSNSEQVMHCSASACGATGSLLHTGTGTLSSQVHKLSSTSAYGCTTDSQGVRFHKSVGGTPETTGFAWTDVVVGGPGTTGGVCDVATFDGTHYGVLWSNLTSDDWIFSISTTGGGTGTWVSYLVQADTVLGYDDAAVLIAYSDTEYMAFIGDGGSDIDRCKTTTSGVSWTCNASLLTDADFGGGVEVVSGIAYFALADRSSDSVKLVTVPSFNDDPTTQVVWSTSSGSYEVCDADVAVFSATTIAVSFVLCSLSVTAWGYIAESVDGGANWDPEVAYTSAAASNQLDTTHTGISYTSTGTIVAYFQYQSADNADPAGTDADASAERIWAAVSSASGLVGVSATASVTNLVGFDVDPTGTRAVARTYGGDCVEIWGAKTLGNHAQCPVSGSVETNCDIDGYEDAVAAKYGGELVMFLNCDDPSGSPEFLSIRDPGGAVPSASEFNDCDPGSASGECPYDIDITEPGWGQFDDVGQLGQIKDFPVDYSNRDETFGGGGFVARLAWAFSTQDPDPGEVGVASFVRAEPASPDVAEEAVVGYSATQAEDFCVGLDGDQYYVAAVDDSESTKTWPVSFTGNVATPAIGGAQVFGVSGAIGIDCGGGQVAFIAGSTLYYASRDGTILDTYDLVDTTPRGVAISEEYQSNGVTCDDAPTDATCKQIILAYKDDTDVILVFGTNLGELELLGTLEVTVDGSFAELEVDHHANGAWLAQTGQVDYYDIFNLTNNGTQVPSECIVNCEGDGFTDGDDGDGLFSGSGATIGEAFGTGAFGGNLFLGAVLMGLVAYGVGTGYGNTFDERQGSRALRVNPWAAAVGAALGFLMAWGFGFFTTAVVFSMVVLVGMIVGIRLWVSRSG